MKLKSPRTFPGGEDNLRALDWEASMAWTIARSERRAWRLAMIATGVALIAVIGLACLAPLRTAIPYLIYVDKSTGNATVRIAADAQIVQFSEVLDKHWLSEYVISRERYYWNFLQNDYDRVNLMSAPVVAREYNRKFDGPTALQKVLGSSGEYSIKLISIGITTRPGAAPGIAVVRFVRVENGPSSGLQGNARSFIATIGYEYQHHYFSTEKALLANPLSFQVTSYRVDEELVQDVPRPSGQIHQNTEGSSDGSSVTGAMAPASYAGTRNSLTLEEKQTASGRSRI